MDELTALLQCPRRRLPLRRLADGRLGVDAAGPYYAPQRGVFDFLEAGEPGPASAVHDFYEGEGWEEGDDGQFGDTRVFVDTRPGPLAFTSKCLRRLKRHFAKGGKYLLDAGCGPIAHEELLEFGESFDKRVCVDLSLQALQVARRKLGDRGIYLRGDLANLPVQDGSVDAVTCNHVIYQVPAELQRQALLELHRVLKPGGVAVVISWWPHAPLAWRIERLVRLFVSERQQTPDPDRAGPSHNPLPRSWFEGQTWPFKYDYDAFRVVTNQFMKTYVGDGWGGRLLLDGIFALQTMAPRYCGKHGAMPAIVIEKV